MFNRNVLLIFVASLTLAACGSDTKKTPSDIPVIPDGYGDNNDPAVVQVIEGTWSQDCASIESNLAKRQQVEFGKNTITLTVLDYSDSSCSQLVDRNTFTGAYELKAETLSGNDQVFPFEVIYTQSTSTPFTAEWVQRRQGFCGRNDWAIGKEIDVSDHKSCNPLFDIPLRKHIRFVRNETDRITQQPIIFLDNQSKGRLANGYPSELDRKEFKRGGL